MAAVFEVASDVCLSCSCYHGIGFGNFYLLFFFRKLKIDIGIGKSSVINSEELRIGKIFGKDTLRGIGIGIGKRN